MTQGSRQWGLEFEPLKGPYTAAITLEAKQTAAVRDEKVVSGSTLPVREAAHSALRWYCPTSILGAWSLLNNPARALTRPWCVWVNFTANCYQKLSEKPHERASRLTMSRI